MQSRTKSAHNAHSFVYTLDNCSHCSRRLSLPFTVLYTTFLFYAWRPRLSGFQLQRHAAGRYFEGFQRVYSRRARLALCNRRFAVTSTNERQRWLERVWGLSAALVNDVQRSANTAESLTSRRSLQPYTLRLCITRGRWFIGCLNTLNLVTELWDIISNLLFKLALWMPLNISLQIVSGIHYHHVLFALQHCQHSSHVCTIFFSFIIVYCLRYVVILY